MIADIRSALAQARRHPWFFAGAALSLAIGMSLATAVFSVVNAALLRPLPFRDPDRLVHISETVRFMGEKLLDLSRIPSRHVVAVRTDATALADVAVWTNQSATFAATGGARFIDGARVTTNFLGLLGVRPYLGHDFLESDGAPGARSVIISYSMWTTRFGADSGILNQLLHVAGAPHRVIGVMPDGFGFPAVPYWIPLSFSEIEADARSTRDDDWPPYYTFGRLAPHATVQGLSAELAVIYRRLYGEHSVNRFRSSRAVPLTRFVSDHLRDQLQLWIAIAILVALLCAVNFATVSLARGMRRRSEIAIRSAMGASWARIIRLLMAESVLIALAGGAAAIVLGSWLLGFVSRLFANGAIVLTPTMSWPTVLFGILGTTVVGVLFAIAPAIELAKVDLRSRLQGEGAQTTAARGDLRGRTALVGLQLCLALTAIAGVCALIAADRRNWAHDVVVDARRLVMATIGADTAAKMPAAGLIDRLKDIEGVANAAVIRYGTSATVWTDDAAVDAFPASISDVSPDYFTTLGVPLRAGRLPSGDEIAQDAPVAVIESSVARQAFGSDIAALGRRLHVKPSRKPGVWLIVTGVVPDIGGHALNSLSAEIYTMQERPLARGTVVVQTRGEPQYLISGIRNTATAFDSRLSLGDVRTARSLVDGDRAARRGRTTFMLSVAALALILAVVGMFGLTAYNVESRAKELGIRVALGGSPARLAGAMVRDLWLMAALGISVALLASGRLTAFLDSVLRNPMAEHPLVVFQWVPAVAAAAALCLVIALGMAVPLRRVMRMDVMRAIQAGSIE